MSTLNLNHLELHPALNAERFVLTIVEEVSTDTGDVVGTQRYPYPPEELPIEIQQAAEDLLVAVIAHRGHALMLDDLVAREVAKRPAIDPLPEGVE